jgi:hypothetical protein
VSDDKSGNEIKIRLSRSFEKKFFFLLNIIESIINLKHLNVDSKEFSIY